ncbi:MAG: hypothetical protein RJA36_3590 [Pseudomonadota bacterium]|jgi:hypothetical protein
MSTTIDTAFTKQFEAEVHVAFQRKGSKLRGTIRTKTVSNAKDTTFQKYGTGFASTKQKHGLVQVSDIAHTNVTATLADYYFGEWVDNLDELKTNIDERQLAAEAGAMALGRKTDELIIAALDSQSTNSTTMGTASKAAFKNSVLSSIGKLNAADVDDDGERWGWVSPVGWSWLMLIDEFVRADYIGNDMLPWKGGFMQVKYWAGVKWCQHSGLSISSNNRTMHLYHKKIAGHAIGSEAKADITWHGDRQAHFIANSISQAAVLIDGTAGCKMVLDESQALATS